MSAVCVLSTEYEVQSEVGCGAGCADTHERRAQPQEVACAAFDFERYAYEESDEESQERRREVPYPVPSAKTHATRLRRLK